MTLPALDHRGRTMKNELLELLSARGLHQVQQAAAWMPRTNFSKPIEADRQQDGGVCVNVTRLAGEEQVQRGLGVALSVAHRLLLVGLLQRKHSRISRNVNAKCVVVVGRAI